MSTLKTTNLQNADASGANIVLGQGSGGGATISGVTTSSTLRATTGIVTTATITTADVTTSRTTTGITTTATIDTATVGGVTTINSDGVNSTGISTATHFIPTAQPYGTNNLIINGSMQVAQYGTSSTTNGYGSLDRWNVTMGNTDEAFTHSQIELSSSDTGPWAEGFHNAMRIQNGNQTSGWQSNSYGVLHQHIEDRDIAQSGWQIESTSSYITVSYWIRSSVAQAFGGHVETYDGTDKTWIWSTGTLSANTWTKITKTIGGSSGLSMSNDNGRGLQIQPWFIWGTDYTASDATLNGWAAYNGGKRFTDMTSTWWTTNDATVDITGVQIEVGKAATPFQHRSYGDELQRCTRYCQVFHAPSNYAYRIVNLQATVHGTGGGVYITGNYLPMRTVPSIAVTGAGLQGNIFTGSWTHSALSSVTNEFVADTSTTVGFSGLISATSAETSLQPGRTGFLYTATNGQESALTLSAEL